MSCCGERHREVGRHQRLAGAALRPENRDQRRGRLARDHDSLAPRDHLLERERDLARSLRERDHVVGSGRERLAQEPVRRALAQNDDRPAGTIRNHAVDHLGHAAVLIRAGDDDDVARLLEEVGPVFVVVGVRDDRYERFVQQRRLDELPVGVLGERDEYADRVGHLVSAPSPS